MKELTIYFEELTNAMNSDNHTAIYEMLVRFETRLNKSIRIN